MHSEREILRLPQPPALSQPLIEALTELCFYEQPEARAVDLLFVFGSNVQQLELGQLIRRAVDQLKVSKIVITGGVARYSDILIDPVAESERIWTATGYGDRSDLRFLLETTSTNTLENVREGQRLCDLQLPRRVLFIAHSYATMRSYLTLRRVRPQGELVGWSLVISSDRDDCPVDKANWHQSVKGRALVWGEYLRFETYGRRGDFPIQTVEPILQTIRYLLSCS